MSLGLLQRLMLTQAARVEWYRSVATTLEAGKPLFETLQFMQRDFQKISGHPMVPLVEELIRRLRGGDRPGAPVRRTIGTELEGLIPNTERMLIDAGLSANRPAEGFRNAAEFVDDLRGLRASVIKGMSIPLVYLCIALAVLSFFGSRVFPAFEAVTPREAWPADVRFLAQMTDNSPYIIAVAAFLVALMVALVLYIGPRWTGSVRSWVDRNLFPFTLIAAVNGAQFLTALKGYVRAGIPFADAVQDIGAGSLPYTKWQCRRIMRRLREGRSMDEAILQLTILPAQYHWLIAVYGDANDPTTSYVRIANEIMQRVKTLISVVFEKTLSTLLLALVGGMILWMYTGMLSIVDPFTVTK
jgi:type II secretory pathway component PulF